MHFPFRRPSGASRQQVPVQSGPARFALTRIIGNDLPPRHAPGRSLKNLRFILENEADLAGCTKRWIVNRIADPDEENAVVATLAAHGQSYSRLGFHLAEFARLERDTTT